MGSVARRIMLSITVLAVSPSFETSITEVVKSIPKVIGTSLKMRAVSFVLSGFLSSLVLLALSFDKSIGGVRMTAFIFLTLFIALLRRHSSVPPFSFSSSSLGEYPQLIR